MRDDLRKVSFSPDGRYLLAQDDEGINVLVVNPFTVAFRIPAENVSDASFTPDSKEIVFLSSSTHVERWSLASQNRSGSANILTREPCNAELLSPDGRTLVCHEAAGTLRLLDVATGNVIFEKKDFGVPWRSAMLTSYFPILGVDTALARMAFSPDGHFFLALPLQGSDHPIALDLKQNTAISLQGELKKLALHRFVFLDSDRLMMTPIVLRIGTNVPASVVRFPSGEVLSTPTMPSGPLYRTTDPDHVIVRPLGKFAAGAIEYATGKGVTSKVPALDFAGHLHAVERITGELALYDATSKVIATVQLPVADLSRFRSFALSSDMNWMAASARTRGGLWNLKSGQSTAQFLSFDNGYFDSANHLIAAAFL